MGGNPSTKTTNTTLKQRGKTHGKFEDNARTSQALKHVMFGAKNWKSLTPSQSEALELIALKISRILTGDANYDDNWHDIQGYAKLIEDQLHGVSK